MAMKYDTICFISSAKNKMLLLYRVVSEPRAFLQNLVQWEIDSWNEDYE